MYTVKVFKLHENEISLAIYNKHWQDTKWYVRPEKSGKCQGESQQKSARSLLALSLELSSGKEFDMYSLKK